MACDGCPPLERLFAQYAEGGGELLVCPICFNSRSRLRYLHRGRRVAGTVPLWQWIGDGATTFSF